MARRRQAARSRQVKAPGRYHHGDLRRALIEASIELIADEGISALTLRGVARRLGVSHAAPRHHFSDKAELLAAIAIEGFEAFAKAQQEALVGITDPWDRFRCLGITYVRFAVENPPRFRVMFSRELAGDPSPRLGDYRKLAGQFLMDVAAEAMASRGEADEERVRTAAITAASLVHGLVMFWIDGTLRHLAGIEPSDDEFDVIARNVVDFIVTAGERGL
jgi:AcrR family transcriptional regulator